LPGILLAISGFAVPSEIRASMFPGSAGASGRVFDTPLCLDFSPSRFVKMHEKLGGGDGVVKGGFGKREGGKGEGEREEGREEK